MYEQETLDQPELKNVMPSSFFKGGLNSLSNPRPILTCYTCGEIFSTRKLFYKHKKTHKIKAKPGTNFVNTEKLQKKAPKGFKSIHSAENNSSISDPSPKVQEPKLSTRSEPDQNEDCEQVGDITETLKNGDAMQINPAPDVPITEVPKVVTYTCNFCDKTFVRQKTYNNHKNKHKRRKRDLERHIRENSEELQVVNYQVLQRICNFISSIRNLTESAHTSDQQATHILRKPSKNCDNSFSNIPPSLENANVQNDGQPENTPMLMDLREFLTAKNKNKASPESKPCPAPVLKCDLCNSTFMTRKAFTKHKYKHKKRGKRKLARS